MENVRQIIFYSNKTPTEFVRHDKVTQRKCSTSHEEIIRQYKIFHGKAEKQAKYYRKCSAYKYSMVKLKSKLSNKENVRHM